jgi:hypothetical protein
MTDRQDHTKRAATSNELAAIFAALEKVNHRLDLLERAVPKPEPASLVHPSQERFTVAEAIADEIFANFKKEKACTFEPNGKPCDHCGMCSSRGF